jgi:hypothetical protein
MRKLLLLPDAPAGGTPNEGSSGMADAIMSELNAAAASPQAAPEAPPAAVTPAGGGEPPKPAAAAPTPTPAKPESPKPGQQPPAKPAAPAAKPAPAEKPLDWKTAPAQFRTAHEKLQQVFEQTKAELSTKITSTEQRLQELANREVLTPEQKQQQARLQERLQTLESDLYARDYRESPEFQAKYEGKARKIRGNIQAELKGLLVNEGGQQRPATVTDFQRVQAENSSLAAQRRLAREMFGDDADVVIKYAAELRTIEESANEEIEAKRNGWGKEREMSAAKAQENQQMAKRIYFDFDSQLEQKFFKPMDGNDDYNKALSEGLKFVDANSGSFSQKTVQEQAQVTALVRRMAASWPAQAVLLKQREGRIAELEAQIAKLAGTDPGAGGEGGAAAPATDYGSGTDGMAAEIAKLGL